MCRKIQCCDKFIFKKMSLFQLGKKFVYGNLWANFEGLSEREYIMSVQLTRRVIAKTNKRGITPHKAVMAERKKK